MSLRLHIIAVGRARQGPERALYEHFAGRLTDWPLTLREVETRGRIAPERLKAAPGRSSPAIPIIAIN